MTKECVIGGRFRIEDLERDLLGRGGMGDVYRATDLTTGRPAAVKALKPEVVAAHPEVLDRFVREGEALSQLDHPNIVKILAAVEEEGRHYLAVEYIGGGSLHDLLAEQGPLGVERAVELAIDVADALTRAHRLGIIHRDLKPANVLLDEAGIPHLTDFGLARVLRPRDQAGRRDGASLLKDAEPITQPGLVVGTLNYLSPEAAQGQVLDARTDIWSFGVMLYEMLAGEPPFQGETAVALLAAILTQPVPDLVARSPGVPDSLADLVYRMLDKDPAQRIPSVRLVGAELEAVLAARGPDAPTEQRRGRPDADGDRAKLSTAPTPGSPQMAARRHKLPAQTIPFVGRQAELAELGQLLAGPQPRLLAVVGAGGMGKTRLALEAAAGQLDRFPDGVYFVPLAPLQSADGLVPAIAEVLGLTFYGSREPRRQLLDYLAGRTLLLILDNCEHLLASTEPSPSAEAGAGQTPGDPREGGAALVADLLAAAPGVKVLATSRSRLNLQGEQIFPLEGMTSEAVELFLQAAHRARPGWEPAPGDLEHVAHICRLVGGMPLAILLAAAWLEMLAPAEIAAEIARSYDFLESSLADLPERQRSLRAVFDYSWHLLTPREREAFQALSVFRGGFSRDAAQTVTGASLRELMTLAGKSLVHREPTGRYQVHDLLRQYAAEKLAQAPEVAQAVHSRHAAYYAAALATWGAELKSARQHEALGAIDDEIENVRAAWTWAVLNAAGPAVGGGPAITDIAAMADGLGYFYEWRGRYLEGAAAFRLAAERLATLDDPAARRLRARVLAWESDFVRALGAATRNEQLLAEALALLEGLDETEIRPEMAFVRLQMGHSYGRAGDYREARRQHGQSLVLYRALGDTWGTADTLASLGLEAHNLAMFGEAKRLLDESLAIYRALGDRRGAADALRALGLLALAQGATDEGAQRLKESVNIRKELGDRPSLALGLLDWASMHNYSGEFDRSYELYQEALALYQDLGNRPLIAITHADLANAESHRGRYEQARAYGEKAIAMAGEVGDRAVVARTHFVLGGVLLAAGQAAEARRLLEESVSLYRAAGLQNALAISLGALGGAQLRLGDPGAARQHLTEALRLAVALRTFVPKMITLALTARLLADQGQAEQAVELYALLERYPFVARSRFFADVAGREIALAAAALPPAVAAAARALGESRDLDATAAEVLADLERWKPYVSPFHGLRGTAARGRPPI